MKTLARRVNIAQCTISRNTWVYFSDKGGGGQPHIQEILGGNMKTRVAVYEEGLFDRGGGGGGAKLFKGGQLPPLTPPP